MMARRDGRPLVTEHPVKPEDFVEYYEGPIPEGAIACKLGFDDDYEEWMDDV